MGPLLSDRARLLFIRHAGTLHVVREAVLRSPTHAEGGEYVVTLMCGGQRTKPVMLMTWPDARAFTRLHCMKCVVALAKFVESAPGRQPRTLRRKAPAEHV